MKLRDPSLTKNMPGTSSGHCSYCKTTVQSGGTGTCISPAKWKRQAFPRTDGPEHDSLHIFLIHFAGRPLLCCLSCGWCRLADLTPPPPEVSPPPDKVLQRLPLVAGNRRVGKASKINAVSPTLFVYISCRFQLPWTFPIPACKVKSLLRALLIQHL